jgi:hypothetical protein
MLESLGKIQKHLFDLESTLSEAKSYDDFKKSPLQFQGDVRLLIKRCARARAVLSLVEQELAEIVTDEASVFGPATARAGEDR